MERIKWDEAKGNPFMTRIHPDMLHELGYEIKKDCKLVNEKNHVAPQERIVVFDAEYVRRKLQSDLFLLARHTPEGDFKAIFKDIWIASQAGKNGD
jgi:hypothetical protein